MRELELPLPDDFHVHLRQGPAMAAYAARTALHFGRFLAMPNTVPPLGNGLAVADYRAAMHAAIQMCGNRTVPLASFKLMAGMGAEAVLGCVSAGAVVGKYYPAGVTTNSADGITDPSLVDEELRTMEKAGMILCIHGEDPSAPELEREAAFLPVIDRMVSRYPRLRIVMEHLSTAAAVEAVLEWPQRVAATITAHHLAFTLDSGYHCKPVIKTPRDRAALVQAAISANPRFFFGSDSAPHPPAAKAAGAAGVYAAPVAMPLLAAVFEAAGALDRLEGFVSSAGARFYGLQQNEGMLRLSRQEWIVPELVDGVAPLEAGKILAWQAHRA